MNAESAAFVPSARGRKLSSSMTTVEQHQDNFAQSQQQHEASNSTSSKIPRSTSAHVSSSLAETAAGKSNNVGGHHHAPSTSGNTSSSHSRSSSLPGNGSSSSNRGRGASSTRGRGSSSRGRGGARGGNSSTSDRSSTHQPKKSADPPSRPPVALDSVDEFPALGGGPPPSNATITEAHSTATDKDSSPALNKSSPTLSPSQSFKGLSFARVVAPAPPPSAAPSAPSSSNATSSAPSDKKTRTSSVSSPSITSHSPSTSNPSSVSEQTRATSPSTSLSPVLGEQGESHTGATAAKGTSQPTTGKKKKKRSSKDQPQPGQPQGQGLQNAGQNFAGPSDPAFNMYNGVYAEGGAYEGDPFNVVIPDDAQRPYFEGPLDPSGVPIQQQSPQPGLTPVQIAFLAANGFNIEGMPNVANDAGNGMSVEALQEYYNPPMPPQDVVNVQASSSNLGKSTSGKKEFKKSKKERNQAGFPHQQMNGQNGVPPYGNFDTQQAGQFPYFDPQYYDEQQQYAQFQQQDQQPQGPFDPSYQQSQEQFLNGGEQSRPSLASTTANHNGSFHFHPDVPSFQPRHFSADAQEFKPKSPLLHVDAPEFVPPQYQEGTEEKAPNGFVSAVGQLKDEATPKPTPEELPEQAESTSTVQEVQGEQTTAVEQVQDKVVETFETVKETISNITSNEPAEEKKEEEQVQEEPTVVEQVQDTVNETIETVKETVSYITSNDVAVEEQEEQADESSKADEPETAQNEDEATPAEESQSPPHSTFSLLPPVTVEDVLDKAQSMADSVKETAHDAVTAVEETVQSVAETVTETFTTSNEVEPQEGEDSEQITKDNLDELDIANDEEASSSAPGVEEHTSQEEASANIDELDLPDSKVIDELETARHGKDSSSTSASDSVAPESSQYSISPSEVEHQLATSTEGESGMPVLQAEIEAIAQTSFTASTVPQFEIIPQSEDRCAISSSESNLPEQQTLEIISSSVDICDVAFEASGTPAGLGPRSPLQIISRSDDQCETEDATRGARSATLDSLASTDSSAVPFVRSSAPSPASRAEDLAPSNTVTKPEVPALSIPLSTPPVVISPSTPISPDSGSPIRPSQLFSPKPLSKKWQPQRPEPLRQPSEAEKDAAIRLVRELRSEPSTPMLESEDMLAGTSSGTINASTPGESTESDTFKFDLSGRFSELITSKRKREKRDNEEEEDEDPDKKERKVDDSGEAPSLTMSIFSGSILPRKQFIVSIFASLGINLFLPFVNGVMLGFGEIFARDWLGPLFGFGRNRSSSNTSNQSFSQSGLGIRGAGNQRGGAQDVPGHAAAKTAIETVTEEVVQAPSKL